MAKVQIKPTASGSFTDVTGKTTTGIVELLPYARAQALFATNLLAFSQGAAGARTTTANKQAAAVGRVLQWV